jgi:tRNA A37 threonylcarbamoyladenosine dehydratase
VTVAELILTLQGCNMDAPVYIRTGAGKFLLIDEDIFHLESPNRVEIAIEFREQK